MVILVVIGVFVVLFGFIALTDRVDNYWTQRGKKIHRLPPLMPVGPPFRTSLLQCTDCGRDDQLLSIDTGQCLVCFEVAAYG